MVFSQGDPSKHVLYTQQDGVGLSVVKVVTIVAPATAKILSIQRHSEMPCENRKDDAEECARYAPVIKVALPGTLWATKETG